MRYTYTVLIEEENGHYSAIAPDAVAVGLGDTLDEVRQSVRDGLLTLVKAHALGGPPLPAPATTVEQARRENPEMIVETIEIDVPDGVVVTTRA